MARLGMFSMPWAGHLNPLCALAWELESRGHEVLFFHLPEFAAEVESRGCTFRPYGEGLFPAGTFAARNLELSCLKGEESAAFALETTRMCGEALLREAATRIREAGLDLWLIDHLDYAASVLARSVQAPFVTLITTLMRHSERGVPGFSGEPPEAETRGLSRFVRPWLDILSSYSERAGLGPFCYDSVWSRLAQITQQPAEFEFPRRELPACFHFTGPFLSEQSRRSIPFPWDCLDGKSLLYASLGSVMQGNLPILQAVIDAVAELDVQLVLSVGRNEKRLRLASNSLALPAVPQLELLEKTDLMIHHAGMNSTLECLAKGVPMLVIPLASDQPGIARRVEWSGVGVEAQSLDAEALRSTIKEMLGDERYRIEARRFQRIISAGRGLRKAADIVEQVVQTGRPVL